MFKRQPQTQHPGLPPPGGHQSARFGRFQIDASHDGEPIRVQPRRLERQIVAISLSGRGDYHRAVDTGLVHFAEEVLPRKRRRTVRLEPQRRPGPIGRVRAPDMDL